MPAPSRRCHTGVAPVLCHTIGMSVVPIVAVVGPTASGKTDLSLDLAEGLGGEVVNTDAMQVYRGMDIGTRSCRRRSAVGSSTTSSTRSRCGIP